MRNYYGKRRMGRLDEDLNAHRKAEKKAYDYLKRQVLELEAYIKYTIPDVSSRFEDPGLKEVANNVLETKEWKILRSHVKFMMDFIKTRNNDRSRGRIL